MRALLPFAFALLLVTVPLTGTAQPTNARALEGVEDGKVVWNITLSKPRPLALQMKVLHQTYKDLKEADLDPKMVLAFHGRNVHYLTEDLSEIPLDIEEPVKDFRANLENLLGLDGVRVEACALANQAFGVDNDAIQEEVAVVANSYASFIGYQKKGYAIIGIH
ncbi:DsrE family protein [Thiohalorhabdus sp.]|uniref:DsrE family protein n=1 Tax=Thiohalorhabdus sp. TaxID=3094134 RepID=UPI002FC38B4B